MRDWTVAGLIIGHFAALIHHSIPLGAAWGVFAFFAAWFCDWYMNRDDEDFEQ